MNLPSLKKYGHFYVMILSIMSTKHLTALMPEDELKNHLLDKLTLLFTKSGGNIQDFNLPRQAQNVQLLGVNQLIEEQLQHDTDSLTQQAKILIAGLNTEQFNAFKTIVDIVLANRTSFYFVSAYGGTGKTYL
jgi:hypothetical protein